MTDVAFRGENGTSLARIPAAERFGRSDSRFHNLTRAAAFLVLAIFAGIILALANGSLLAFKTFGFGFLTHHIWNPVTEKFVAVAPVVRTLLTSSLAATV